MQSSLRTPRESPASGAETAGMARRESARSWFPRLLRLWDTKVSGETFRAPEGNPLLAFPSEATPRTESDAIDGAVRRAEFRTSAPARPDFVRPLLIVLLLVAVPSLGVLAIRQFPPSWFS